MRADVTLTFGCAKPGFYLNDGPKQCGRVRVLSPGFPRALVEQHADTHEAFGPKQIRWPARPAGANKTHFGHALIVAGGEGTVGAGQLAAEAAFRTGAGYVTWAGPTAPAVTRCPEVMSTTVDDDRAWTKATAVVLGPGLGVGERTLRSDSARVGRGPPGDPGRRRDHHLR